jgi:dihydrodipicolinate synthase/N-acetylneuraminate lyase
LIRQKFRGIISPIITPFDQNEKLDEKVFRREAKYLYSTGIHGISPGGSTGEGNLLHDDELVRMIEILQEENINHIPVVAGIIRPSTRDAIVTGKKAKEAGANALMITPIQYLGGTDDNGNYEYYDRISEAVGLPIIIYNVVPQNAIKPDLFYRLLDIENVIGIKQSVGGIEAFYEMKMTCGKKGYIYAATDDMLYSCFDLGADGAIAAILTLFPEYCVKMWDAVNTGDRKTAIELQTMIYPIWNKIKGSQFPRRIKESINQRARDVGIACSPLSDASKEEKDIISEALNAL